jgi:hypothetical protein
MRMDRIYLLYGGPRTWWGHVSKISRRSVSHGHCTERGNVTVRLLPSLKGIDIVTSSISDSDPTSDSTHWMLSRSTVRMSRRSLSSTSDLPSPKRARLERHLTSHDFKNGLFLAPMVRSGARTSFFFHTSISLPDSSSVPTRLFALKHGATLVWGPEMVDKAILHSERVVDRA